MSFIRPPETWDDETANKYLLRADIFSNWLNSFCEQRLKKESISVELKQNSPEILTMMHFELRKELLGPVVKNRIDKFKIASLTEFVIMLQLPIVPQSPDPKDILYENSQFALFVGYNIVHCFENNSYSTFYPNNKKPLGTDNEMLNDMFQSIVNKHLDFFATPFSKPVTLPIVSNAFFWEFFEFFHCAKWCMNL